MVCPSTKCELMSRIAWRVAARMAGRPSRRTIVSRIVSGISPGWMMRAAIPSVHAEADTRSAVRFDVAVEPAAGGELVLDQAVGGRGIGHAQQRLGQHHQRQPFLGRERIGVQKSSMPPSPPRPPVLARIASTSVRARASMRRSRRVVVRGVGQQASPPIPRPAAQTAPGTAAGRDLVRSWRAPSCRAS